MIASHCLRRGFTFPRKVDTFKRHLIEIYTFDVDKNRSDKMESNCNE